MSMTRQHFQALAETVGEIQFYLDDPAQSEIVERHITGFCARQNPRFNAQRFQRAIDKHLQEIQEGFERLNAKLDADRRKALKSGAELGSQGILSQSDL